MKKLVFFLLISICSLTLQKARAEYGHISIDGNSKESGNKVICEAEVDCDLVAGSGYVKCFGYDPAKRCYSYTALGKVKCDDREHKCVIIP